MSGERVKTLHLTLHREWFDLIRSGKKTEEYRKYTRYWNSRLLDKKYDVVKFVNGYGAHRPFMIVECKGIWAYPGKWIITLGKILEVGNV